MFVLLPGRMSEAGFSIKVKVKNIEYKVDFACNKQEKSANATSANFLVKYPKITCYIPDIRSLLK